MAQTNQTTPPIKSVSEELSDIKCSIRYLVELNEPVLCEKFGEEATHGFNLIAQSIFSRMDRLISLTKN